MPMLLKDLKAHLRNGEFAFPGGYPKFFIVDDGEAMSFAAVRSNLREIMRSTFTNARDGWQIEACEINWEDSDLYCAHTNKQISSAYGVDSNETEA